jgi:hypothetical protein
VRLTRLGSKSIPSLPYTANGGRCPACLQPVRARESGVCLYGDVFHRDCAFYTPHQRGGGARR